MAGWIFGEADRAPRAVRPGQNRSQRPSPEATSARAIFFNCVFDG